MFDIAIIAWVLALVRLNLAIGLFNGLLTVLAILRTGSIARTRRWLRQPESLWTTSADFLASYFCAAFLTFGFFAVFASTLALIGGILGPASVVLGLALGGYFVYLTGRVLWPWPWSKVPDVLWLDEVAEPTLPDRSVLWIDSEPPPSANPEPGSPGPSSTSDSPD